MWYWVMREEGVYSPYLTLYIQAVQRVAACYWDLSDRLRWASQYAHRRHTSLSTTNCIRQFRIISLRRILANRGAQVGRTRVRKRNIPGTLKSPHFCRTSRQWADHSLSWQHANHTGQEGWLKFSCNGLKRQNFGSSFQLLIQDVGWNAEAFGNSIN